MPRITNRTEFIDQSRRDHVVQINVQGKGAIQEYKYINRQAIKISAGINGFGRFAMHLMRYWIQNYEQANFSIDYINDEILTLDQIRSVIKHDYYLSDLQSHITFQESSITITFANDEYHVIEFTHCPSKNLVWVGKPIVFLECSGSYTDADKARTFHQGETQCVIISASSANADQTLLFGFNHESYSINSSVVSYGSCTVNAYVPLAHYIHTRYGIVESDVHVIHNVPAHKFVDSHTLERRSCTLQWSAKNLLRYITPENFKVTYTVVPYLGVSLIDFRFQLAQVPALETFQEQLSIAMNQQELRNLYAFADHDHGPEQHKFTPYSAVILKNSMSIVGQNLYVQAYFDNENSATRYFDLTNYISETIKDQTANMAESQQLCYHTLVQ